MPGRLVNDEVNSRDVPDMVAPAAGDVIDID
jgi:hypothetical protein